MPCSYTLGRRILPSPLGLTRLRSSNFKQYASELY